MRSEIESFSAIVGSFYDAALDVGSWDEALARFINAYAPDGWGAGFLVWENPPAPGATFVGCARGQLHAVWVLTRSENGKHKLYSVPPAQRALVRQRAAAWRRYQRARARFVQQLGTLLALADQIAQTQRLDWPPP